MKICVTGAGGYIGSVLCPLLIEVGYDVTAVDLDLSSLVMCCSYRQFNPVKANILSMVMPSLLDEADVVVHLAGVVGAALVDKNPDEAKSTMRAGTRRLLDLARGKPIIYPNTDSGYGAATSLYAQLKIEGEQMVLAAGGTSLRLGSVFGAAPRMRHSTLLNWMAQQAVVKGFLALSQPQARRTLLHVEDCGLAIIHAIGHHKQMAGEAYDVALPRAVTKLEMCQALAAQLPEFRWIMDESAYQDADERDFEPDASKLAALGFRTMHGLADGVAELVRVYRAL